MDANRVAGEPFAQSAFVVFSTYRKRSPVQTTSVSRRPVWSKTVAWMGGADADVRRTVSSASPRTITTVVPRTSPRQPKREQAAQAVCPRDPDGYEEQTSAHRGAGVAAAGRAA